MYFRYKYENERPNDLLSTTSVIRVVKLCGGPIRQPPVFQGEFDSRKGSRIARPEPFQRNGVRLIGLDLVS
jgi:hypothetical protein